MFLRGFDNADDMRFNHGDSPATVSAYRLDRYEVTVARFRSFVEAGFGTRASPPADGAGAHALTSGTGWSASFDDALQADRSALSTALLCDPETTWSVDAGGGDNRAMSCLDWYEAFAFCIWDGGYLPTEAEWNFAASAGNEQRAYPWSSPAPDFSIDCAHANYGGDNWPATVCPRGIAGGTVPGSTPDGDGAYGQADLAGNVTEFTLDKYDPAFVTPCVDCVDTATSADRIVVRGGAYEHAAPVLRTSYRAAFDPGDRFPEFGVRCARPL